MLNTKTNESGRSMIEMLGVLAIIGVLSVGGIAGYSKAMTKFKINKTLDQVSMLVTNIRTMYAQQGNYNGLNDALAINLHLVDDAMVTGSALKSPFGTVAIGVADAALIDASGETDTAFTIKLSNLPDDACVAIATNAWGSAFSSGFLGIGVGADIGASECTTRSGTASTTGVACSVGNGNSAQIMPVATAATQCNGGGKTVMLKYY